MCRRAFESNGEMRTSRCTPDSVLSQPWALWPLTIMVADLMPASSPAVSSIDLDVEFPPLGPAHVHAQEHARPVAALGAAGARMDFDIGVVGVGLARQQRLELAALALRLQRLQRARPSALGRRVALGLAEFDQRRRVVEVALNLGERAQPVLEHRALAHQLLRGFGIVPEVGVFGFGVEFGEPARRGLDVKDASSAVPRTA